MSHGNNSQLIQCEDFMAFEEALRKMRKIDDNIVYALNTSIPTESFVKNREEPKQHCQQLWGQLMGAYTERESLIKDCIKHSSEKVIHLKKMKEENESDPKVIKNLRNQTTQLRLLQKELNVEEVIRERTTKIFHEKCRTYYRPPVNNL